MKKFLSSFSVGILVIGTCYQLGVLNLNFGHAAGFNDVPSNHPNFTAIDYVQSQGIVSGYPDGSFKPGKTINRAEFVKILIGTIFDQTTISSCPIKPVNLFRDVARGQWFTAYVCVSKINRIITGYTDGSFKPDNQINFAEAAKIIALSFNLQLGPGEKWYEPFVNALGAKNAIPGTITGPDQKITRAEMAEMIYRLKTGKSSELSSSIENIATDSTGEFAAFEDEVISLVNAERAKNGLSPLRHSVFLEKAAQAFSDDMQARDFFREDHMDPEGRSPSDRIIASGYLDEFNACNCTRSYSVGENIAKGQSTPADVMESWMKSTEHRTNILRSTFSEIGIGITKVIPKRRENFTGYLWVQNFGDVNLER
jgi:uncharacterized protein YkwD